MNGSKNAARRKKSEIPCPGNVGLLRTAWRANDVREMRINPDGLHPTPVEEHSKVVRTRTALLALQARAAAAPAAASAR